MTNLVARHVEEYQQVRGQRGLLDRASIDIGRLEPATSDQSSGGLRGDRHGDHCHNCQGGARRECRKLDELFALS